MAEALLILSVLLRNTNILLDTNVTEPGMMSKWTEPDMISELTEPDRIFTTTDH